MTCREARPARAGVLVLALGFVVLASLGGLFSGAGVASRGVAGPGLERPTAIPGPLPDRAVARRPTAARAAGDGGASPRAQDAPLRRRRIPAKATHPVDPSRPDASRVRPDARVRSGGDVPKLVLLEVGTGDPLGDLAETGVRVVGFDFEGPRDLDLWQVDLRTGRSARLGAARSGGGDGLFSTDGLLPLSRGIGIVATPVGGDPLGPEASRPLGFAPRPEPPPRVWCEAEDPARLHVAPDPRPYWLVFGDADGEELARLRIPAHRGPMRMAAGVSLAPELLALADGSAGRVRVAAERDDGRRSGWTRIHRAFGLPRRPEPSAEPSILRAEASLEGSP